MIGFSVIVPLYNKGSDILKTLDSVLQQTHTSFEVIVINDGSTDDSESQVKTVNDQRIKLFTKQNEGVGPTRNFAVTKATFPYIAFLDADDIWKPNHLETFAKLISDFPNANWFATGYEIKHHKNLILPADTPLQKKAPYFGEVNNYFANSLVDCLAWTSAVAMKTSFFNELNGFDTTITHGAGEDTDLWLRAALKSNLVITTEITALYNLEGSNRISLTPTLDRVFMNPDAYIEQEKNNTSLKQYLDLNRYSFAMQHKIANDFNAYKRFKRGLNPSNLNSKQRLLLKLPRFALILLLKVKSIFEKSGIRLSSFSR